MTGKNLATLILVAIVNCAVVAFVVTNKTAPQPIIQQSFVTPPVPTQPIAEPPKANTEQAKNTISESDLRKHISWLAHDAREGRMSGKRGNIVSADYIADHFNSLGLQVTRQKFPIKRTNPGPNNETGDDFTHNIIGVLPGRTSRTIIIGGHMDHIGYGPEYSRQGGGQIHNGADDNASGTGSVMEVAEAFTKMEKLNHTLVFICFSAEEMGLIGSRYFVKQLTEEEKSNIDLMVNFDMVGYLKDQKTNEIYGIKDIPEVNAIVGRLTTKYPIRFSAGEAGSGGSDHAPFGNAGIPYAFFHTGLHAHYHKPSDDVERLDFKGQELVTKFAFEMVDEFDKINLVRKAAFSYPTLNEEFHDHGHSEEHHHPTNLPAVKELQ